MDRGQAIDRIRQQKPLFLQAAKKKGYVCPKCGNGTGKDGDGILLDPKDKARTHYKCFVCGLYADVIELFGIANNLTGFMEQLSGVGAYYGIEAEEMYQNPVKSERDERIHTNTYTHKPQHDYTAFFDEAHKHLKETDYWQKRMISEEIAERFTLGYAAEWRHPEVSQYVPLSPRLIIPTSSGSYIARDTRAELTEEQERYCKSKVGTVHIFNGEALQTATKPIFLTEGEIDALCIMSAGGEAVALGGANNAKGFISLLEGMRPQKPAQPIVIALDNDAAGERAAQEVEEGLKRLDIPHYRHNPYGDSKDAGEAILKDRAALISAMGRAYAMADEAAQAEREAYLKTSIAYYLQSFIDGISDSVNTPCVSTGFSTLDAVLDGGLYEGLYVIGAISSLGKTTLITQIADQIAQAGTDVLIFSLEMARNELIAKSISRHTLIKAFDDKTAINNAKTSRGITTGKRYVNYSKTEQELIRSSINAYSAYAGNIYISEGVGDIGAVQIREAVERHISFTGKKPVVIVDYLQILAPYNERYSDKQNNDKAMLELKRTSRDNKIPLIAISSFNRENYKEEVNMTAFKETGSIEYSSDVLIGLQLKGAGSKTFDATAEKKKDPRSIELVILKNRNGRVGDRLPFQYYPLFNFFKEG